MVRILETLRYLTFYITRYVVDRQILKHLGEINNILNNDNAGVFQSPNDNSLNNILKHAITTVPWYSEKNISPALYRFPVTNKSIIRESFDEFCSNGYRQSDLIAMITSGSTGTPFKIYQDRNKKLRNYADTLYFAGLAGYKTGHRLVYLKIWVKEKMKSPLAYRLQNIVPVDVIRFNDREIEALINRMEKDRSTFGLLGYASALELICRYLDKTGTAL